MDLDCFQCNKRKPTIDPSTSVTKNNRNVITGKCEINGKKYRFGKMLAFL